jgi:tetratricopeptide (TPR) repeat protein
VLLFAVVLATHHNGLHNDFSLDGRALIPDSTRVHAATTENVVSILTTDYWWPYWVSGAYRPLTTLSFLLEFSVLGFGKQPTGYHWTNLLLHWLNTFLVYLLARRLVAQRVPALLAATLFAVHPITPDVVANLAGRADLLAAAAVLGALLLYVRGYESQRRHLLWTVAASFVLSAGAFSKETALVGLPLMVWWDLLMRPGGLLATNRVRTVVGWVILGVPTAALFLARHLVYRAASPFPLWMTTNVLVTTDFWTARMTACKTLWRYLVLLVWPAQLTWDYSVSHVKLFQWRVTDWEDAQAVGALMILSLIGLVALWLRRRLPGLLFSTGFSLAALLPTSNLLVLIPAVMAERFLYLPLAGVAAAAAIAADLIARGAARFSQRRGPALAYAWYALLAICLVPYAARTYERNFDWRDDLTICGSALEVAPQSFRVQKGMARALYKADKVQNLDAAIAAAERAQSILEENAPKGVSVPGLVLQDLGTYYRAKANLVARQGLDPAEADVWLQRAQDVLARAVSWEKEVNEEHRQVEMRRGVPFGDIVNYGNTPLYEALAAVYLQRGLWVEALATLQHLLALQPAAADTYLRMSAAAESLHRTEEAILYAMQAFMVDPQREEVWPRLHSLYRILDPQSCAFVLSDGQYRFDDTCPAVRSHICRAFASLHRNFLYAGNRPAADAARSNAENNYGCAKLATSLE